MSDVNPLERLSLGVKDRYTIERELGRGGMAIVYLAHELAQDRPVALKVLLPHLATVVGPQRFLREIDITQRMSHPRILPLLDAGRVDGIPYYVMPYIEGESLHDRLTREVQLGIEEALTITRQVAEALSHAHAQGIVHRDIKPGNILLGKDGPVVTDFGIARAIDVVAGEELTSHDIVVGTPEYMSPEQGQAGGHVDARSDIYSLACVLYHMLAGEPPFTGPSAQVVIARQMAEPPRSLAVTRSRVPPSVEYAIDCALAKVPADRPETVERFVAMFDQPPPTEEVRPTPRSRRAALLLGLVTVIVLAAAVALKSLFGPGSPDWANGRPSSVVVMAFRSPSTTAEEHRLADDLAADVALELNNWESIRAIPRVSLSGPVFDAGLSEPTFARIQDGIAVTRAVAAEALAGVSVRIRGDTAFVETTLFDANSGKSVDVSLQTAGLATDRTTLAGPIVYGILGVEETGRNPGALRRLTAEPDALNRHLEGERHLAEWRLPEAEASFRAAIERDSTFASAMLRLAQTLYWGSARDNASLTTYGQEIARLSAVAVRHSANLGHRDSAHLAAFDAFQLGEYDRSRALYHELLQADSTDVYAWLMLGGVEFTDPWLVEGGNGAYLPRGNWNVASQAFQEAVRLQPTFDLGYGHLFAIYRQVAAVIDRRSCPGFELPRDEAIPPWGDRAPHQARPFCPVVLDTILWVTREVFGTLDVAAMEVGAERLFRQSVTALRRWADFAPTLPRPREEIVAAVLLQRSRLGPVAPATIDSLARIAATSAAEALALMRDTLPNDLVRLANLALASGDVDSALALTDEALARYRAHSTPVSMIPPTVANVYLATGQPTRALAFATNNSVQRYIMDSVAGALVSYGGAEAVITRMRVLGATGVTGPLLQEAFDSLSRLWRPPRYSERQVALLCRHATQFVIQTLALWPLGMDEWDLSVENASPLWRALVASTHDTAMARMLFTQARGRALEPVASAEFSSAFVAGVIAARLGDYPQSLASLSRLDSLPPGIELLDTAWGLRHLSYLWRARAHQAHGDDVAAAAQYRRFLADVRASDPLIAPLVHEARRNCDC
jgi:tetratricopeptide (TPR) repeat protein